MQSAHFRHDPEFENKNDLWTLADKKFDSNFSTLEEVGLDPRHVWSKGKGWA